MFSGFFFIYRIHEEIIDQAFNYETSLKRIVALTESTESLTVTFV